MAKIALKRLLVEYTSQKQVSFIYILDNWTNNLMSYYGLTLNDVDFLVSLGGGGGSKMTLREIVVSGGSNFDTDPTNSVSYKSWHPQLKFETSLRSVRLIVWPQEVSKVTEVKMKKI